MVENAQSWPEFELKHFTTPYMQLPLPAVFHDKTKRTQQGNLLAKNRNKTGLKWKRFNVDKTMKSAVRWDMVSANTASSEPQCYKQSDGSQDARRESQDIPNEPSD